MALSSAKPAAGTANSVKTNKISRIQKTETRWGVGD